MVVAGGRRKIETFDGEDAGTNRVLDEEEAKKLAEDPFYKLEHTLEDEKRAKEAEPRLHELQELMETKKNDYVLSSLLRKDFRVCIFYLPFSIDSHSLSKQQEKKKEVEKLKQEGEKLGLGLSLLPHSSTDKLVASQVQFRGLHDLQANRLKRKLEVKSSSIFGKRSDTEEAKRQLKINIISKKKKV